ncbi:DUF6801 domain-containing protein [Herbihabitans rhizosphaerae]
MTAIRRYAKCHWQLFHLLMRTRVRRAMSILALTLTAAAIGLPATAAPAMPIGVPVPVSNTAQYRMTVPLLGTTLIDVKTTAVVTPPLFVGGTLHVAKLRQSMTLPPSVVQGLRLVGATKVEISGGPGLVAYPGIHMPIPIPCGTTSFPLTALPESGPATLTAAARDCQRVVIPHSGVTSLGVDFAFDATVTARKSDDTLTELGVFTTPCYHESTSPWLLLEFHVLGISR